MEKNNDMNKDKSQNKLTENSNLILKDLKELYEYSKKGVYFNENIINRFHPKFNRIYYLYNKYIPKKTENDQKIELFMLEVNTIKKMTRIFNNVLTINAFFFGLLYLQNKSTTRLKLFLFVSTIMASSYLLDTYASWKFCVFLNIVMKDNIKFMIHKMENPEKFVDENFNKLNNVKKEINELDKIKEKQLDIEYQEHVRKNRDLIEFYSKWFYGPIDIDLENKLYFSKNQKDEMFSNDDVLDYIDNDIDFLDNKQNKLLTVKLRETHI